MGTLLEFITLLSSLECSVEEALDEESSLLTLRRQVFDFDLEHLLGCFGLFENFFESFLEVIGTSTFLDVSGLTKSPSSSFGGSSFGGSSLGGSSFGGSSLGGSSFGGSSFGGSSGGGGGS